jgi:hypothetical protein
MVRPLLFAALLLMPCAAFAQENPAGSSNQTSPPVSGDTVQAPPSSSGTTLTLNDLAWTNGSVFTQDSSGVTLTPQVFGGTVALDMPDRRVTLDLDNASLRDALKSVFDQAKEKYEIDKDVPEGPRITLHAKNIRFDTALDVVTQAGGVGWSRESVWKNGEKSHSTTLQSSFRITKAPSVNPFFSAARNLFRNDYNLSDSLKSHRGDLFFNNPKNGSLSYYELVAPEHRSTFTCPHCKGQVTVVRRTQAPKCPKCGRTFQPDWQFCPADGSPRPRDPGEWKFCPLCGKPIDLSTIRAEQENPLSNLPIVGTLYQRFQGNAPRTP